MLLAHWLAVPGRRWQEQALAAEAPAGRTGSLFQADFRIARVSSRLADAAAARRCGRGAAGASGRDAARRAQPA